MIKKIFIDESDLWDSIVKSFENYEIYYLSFYVRAFEIHGDGKPMLIYYSCKDMRAVNVVFLRDISKDSRFEKLIKGNEFFDIITPYGYGGFLIEGNTSDKNLEKLNLEYVKLCNSLNIVSEFVRFNPLSKNACINKKIYDVTDLSKTITIDLDSSDQIWKNITSKNRNVIRKSIKSGVEIYWGRSPELIDEFIVLYTKTMKKDGATDYYYFEKDFYESVLKDLKYNSMFFYAVYEGKIISMSIIIYENKHMHYHLSASDRVYQHLAPTNLLLYEAACWGVNNGFEKFHLGGGLGSKEDNLYKFKKAFNRNSDTVFSIGKKIFDQRKYDELIKMREVDENFEVSNSFFPEYRN